MIRTTIQTWFRRLGQDLARQLSDGPNTHLSYLVQTQSAEGPMLLHLTTCLLDKAVDILIDLSRGGGGRGETAFMYLEAERRKIEKIRK